MTRPARIGPSAHGTAVRAGAAPLGPTHPQTSTVQPPVGGLPLLPLPTSQQEAPPAWWWVGCHGGAGASTLAMAMPNANAQDAQGCWPAPQRPDLARVVLVARTHFHGLSSAQLAARQWASGSTPEGVEVLGLVLVTDAPGKLPRPLREFAQLVSGGLPRAWEIPWIEELRCGAPPQPNHPAYRRIEQDLSHVASGGAHHA